MSGMSGDVDEHPAKSNAKNGQCLVQYLEFECLHSNTMAMAMNIMST